MRLFPSPCASLYFSQKHWATMCADAEVLRTPDIFRTDIIVKLHYVMQSRPYILIVLAQYLYIRDRTLTADQKILQN